MVLQAIQSILDQRLPGLEIIVVDDGSTDNTFSEVDNRYPEVILIRLDGIGPGQARNVGVNASGREIIMFLDSDDLWLPHKLAG